MTKRFSYLIDSKKNSANMPIVKRKINLNILQIAAEKDLRRRSCCPFIKENHSVDNSRNISHLSVEDINELTHPSQEAVLFHKMDYEHLDGNVGKHINLRSTISQKKQGTETLRSKLMYREQIRSKNSKMLLIESLLHIKTPNNRPTTEKNVKQLVSLMLNSQSKFSKERKKLFGAIQHLQTYMNKNEQLDQQMNDATLEQYVEVRSEVNRNGEKCEETKKVMAASRKQFENDVASATQLREKLCDYQNRLQISELDVHNLKEDNLTKKQYLGRLLHLKNEHRWKKDNLHRILPF
ncbi:uncharacterized protein LOC126579233 [Anopheles aquasalis]|uniref:uncharacterized protein LOC126579233 n=1 Tax=Anopheles aquasalis TaxID=42839 RepID=UPI00215A51EE|nr:uncharacterized protein LOC126579233 [Anopheles aquasalis]